jgi:hypothetical protein
MLKDSNVFFLHDKFYRKWSFEDLDTDSTKQLSAKLQLVGPGSGWVILAGVLNTSFNFVYCIPLVH